MIPAGSRRLKIRPPRRLTAAHDSTKPQFDYNSLWDVLANAIRHIQNKNVSSLSYEQLYRIAYTLVLQKHGSRLYDDVASLVGDHLQQRRQKVLQTLKSSLTNTNEAFLKAMCDEWSEHLQLMKFVSDVLMYLNRVYVKECKKLLIYDLGITLFDDFFLRYDGMTVARRLVDILNTEIAKLRVEALSTRLPKVTYTTTSFEKELLLRSEKHFSAVADDALAALSGTRYLHDIYRLIKDEEARFQALAALGSTLLRTETQPKLILLMNNVLIKGKLEHVMIYPTEMQGLLFWLEPVFAKSISKLGSDTATSPSYTQELRMLYELEGRIDPERKRLKVRLRDLIVTQGLQLPAAVLRHLEQQASLNTANGKKTAVNYASTSFVVAWIDTVLEYQQQMAQVVQDAFSGDHTIEFTAFASVKQFINLPTGRIKKKTDSPALNAAELLSVYIDHHIKQNLRPATLKRVATDENVSIDETEAFLTKAIAFLKLVEDKYSFEAHYAAHFAKRFLNAKSASNALGGDIEELVLAKLWEEVFMGSHYLERIVKMKKDVTLSAELTLEWKRHVLENTLSVAELELKICNLSEWPKTDDT
ncbi:hypothetical protein HF325_002851 [Metschnikowia pulcherrima]|uniref:Cullin family profile domain-containing protein n=1 Tax=Metschnikowia pulcherrima TaxID=27326 RepID=A0A8H7L9L5_9ASCO|nr:hypothetical protein HF325_002851 [Metschnikowia pulcherrima]